MNYHTKALLSLAAESPGVILMKNSTVRKPNTYRFSSYYNRTIKIDTPFFRGVFSDNSDMKDTRKSPKIRVIKGLQ